MQSDKHTQYFSLLPFLYHHLISCFIKNVFNIQTLLYLYIDYLNRNHIICTYTILGNKESCTSLRIPLVCAATGFRSNKFRRHSRVLKHVSQFALFILHCIVAVLFEWLISRIEIYVEM